MVLTVKQNVIAGGCASGFSDLAGQAQCVKGHCHDLFHFEGVILP